MSIATPPTPEHFDYIGAAAAAGLSPEQLSAIIRLFEADYPDDLMLRELHVLRACHAVAKGRATIESILHPTQPQAGRAA